MQRSIVFIFMLMCQLAIAQQSRLDKAQSSLESENYEDVLYNAEKALENEVTAKDIMSLYYKAKALFEISKDEKNIVDYPNAQKDAIATAIKLRKHKAWDPTKVELPILVNEIAKDCEKRAKALYTEKKYPKAKKEYENVVKLNNSVHAQYMMARITLEEDKKSGIEMYLVMIDSQYSAVSRDEDGVEILLEPFVETVEYYQSIGQTDKALRVIEKGLRVFPDNKELTDVRKPLFMKSIRAKNNFNSNDSIITALKVYKSALDAFPDDTALNMRFINYAMRFIAKKDPKLRKPNYDSVAIELAEHVAKMEKLDEKNSYIWLVNYFAKAKEPTPTNIYITKFIEMTYPKNPDWGYLKLSDIFLERGDEDLSREIYDMAIKLYPNSTALKEGKIPGEAPKPAPPKAPKKKK